MLPVRSTVSILPRVLRVVTTSHPELPLELKEELKTPSRGEVLGNLDDARVWLSPPLPSVCEFGVDVPVSHRLRSE